MAADRWGVSWGGDAGIWGFSWTLGFSPTTVDPVYGQPFITLLSPMIETISKRSEIITTITRLSEIDEDA